jgi:hypothetical protein
MDAGSSLTGRTERVTRSERGLSGSGRSTAGQSGYRALSFRAAARAEVIHNFNYAQVLTLDLVAKGFGYVEVPISYSFRTTGRSFVRIVPYLRRVVPAVVRELRSAPVVGPPPAPAADTGPSVLHDVG